MVDPTPHALGSLPPLYDSYLQGYRLIDRSGKYKPLVYSNELTVMRQHWQAINGSRDSLPLELSCRPMSLKRFQWIVQVGGSAWACGGRGRGGRVCVSPYDETARVAVAGVLFLSEPPGVSREMGCSVFW